MVHDQRALPGLPRPGRTVRRGPAMRGGRSLSSDGLRGLVALFRHRWWRLRPLAGSAFTTAAGFGILMTSTLTPFKQLGEVTFWAIIFALVASVLVLPSMLVLWDRWHRKRGEDIVDREAYERAHAGL